MRRRRLTHTASSARPSQTPLEGCADDAAPLIPNTVALPNGERGRTSRASSADDAGNLTPNPFPRGKGNNREERSGTGILRFALE